MPLTMHWQWQCFTLQDSFHVASRVSFIFIHHYFSPCRFTFPEASEVDKSREASEAAPAEAASRFTMKIWKWSEKNIRKVFLHVILSSCKVEVEETSPIVV